LEWRTPFRGFSQIQAADFDNQYFYSREILVSKKSFERYYDTMKSAFELLLERLERSGFTKEAQHLTQNHAACAKSVKHHRGQHAWLLDCVHPAHKPVKLKKNKRAGNGSRCDALVHTTNSGS
jgi:hypothetical protein